MMKPALTAFPTNHKHIFPLLIELNAHLSKREKDTSSGGGRSRIDGSFNLVYRVCD
ncbi:hypothetical protein Hanom_Chr05g00419251 [Helianthus anomalus]